MSGLLAFIVVAGVVLTPVALGVGIVWVIFTILEEGDW